MNQSNKKNRKRNKLGRLISYCIGRRKCETSTSATRYSQSEPEADHMRYSNDSNRSLESLPPIFLMPSEDGWNSEFLSDSQLPRTSEGAIVLHRGVGSRRVKQLYFSEEEEKSMDNNQLASAPQSKPFSKQTGIDEEVDLVGWDSPNLDDTTSALPSVSGQDATDEQHQFIANDNMTNSVAIELPTMKRPKDAQRMPENEYSTLSAMKRRATLTTS